MKVTGFYEVAPVPGDKEGGWEVTRNGQQVKWAPDRQGAVIDGVCRAVEESQSGARTRLQVKDAMGRVGYEWFYPRQ